MFARLCHQRDMAGMQRAHGGHHGDAAAAQRLRAARKSAIVLKTRALARLHRRRSSSGRAGSAACRCCALPARHTGRSGRDTWCGRCGSATGDDDLLGPRQHILGLAGICLELRLGQRLVGIGADLDGPVAAARAVGIAFGRLPSALGRIWGLRPRRPAQACSAAAASLAIRPHGRRGRATRGRDRPPPCAGLAGGGLGAPAWRGKLRRGLWRHGGHGRLGLAAPSAWMTREIFVRRAHLFGGVFVLGLHGGGTAAAPRTGCCRNLRAG